MDDHKSSDSEQSDSDAIDATGATAHSSTTWKVLGKVVAGSGTGVLGYNTSTSGAAMGVEGITESKGGFLASPAGVRGKAPPGTGSVASGVLGTTHGTGYYDSFFESPQYATGVLGRASATSGVAYTAGVYGSNASTSGTGHGVYGQTSSVGQGDAGVYGRTLGGSGQIYGVSGMTESPESGAAGVAGLATTGYGYGVKGATSGLGYGVYSEGDAKVTGHLEVTNLGDDTEVVTVDADVFKVTDGSSRILEIEGPGLGPSPGNFVAGDPNNYVAPEASGVVIAGGGDHSPYNNDPRNTPNEVYEDFGTISGGEHNRVGVDDEFEASQSHATIGGGFVNTAAGQYSTIPGGRSNRAMGDTSFAAGKGAGAKSFATFVWNDGNNYHDIDGDGTDDGFSSEKTVFSGSEPTGSQTFHVSAENGVRFVTGTSGATTYISAESSGWNQTSSRAVKSSVDPVEPGAVLDGVEEMPMSTWSYGGEEEDRPRHIGPMAGDFHDALPFDIGDSDEHINSLDADGVALTAIQGLCERLEAKDDRIDDLEAENEQLAERLTTLEDRLADLETEAPSPATADD